jgi:circadian clock protein KaiC
MDRIKTYIKGLDEHMENGVPKGHIVLLAGVPGSMKSSVAYNILFQNAKQNGTKSVYISLEQGRDSLVQSMQRMGMNHQEIENNVTIVDLGYLRLNSETMDYGGSWMSVFRMYAENLKTTMNYDILVIDSLAAVEVLADIKNRRSDLFHLFGWLKEMGITTFIISEATADPMIVRDEDFLADGVFHLDLRREGNVVNLFLGVSKMRMTNHSRGYFPMLFEHGGFELVTE